MQKPPDLSQLHKHQLEELARVADLHDWEHVEQMVADLYNQK